MSCFCTYSPASCHLALSPFRFHVASQTVSPCLIDGFFTRPLTLGGISALLAMKVLFVPFLPVEPLLDIFGVFFVVIAGIVAFAGDNSRPFLPSFPFCRVPSCRETASLAEAGLGVIDWTGVDFKSAVVEPSDWTGVDCKPAVVELSEPSSFAFAEPRISDWTGVDCKPAVVEPSETSSFAFAEPRISDWTGVDFKPAVVELSTAIFIDWLCVDFISGLNCLPVSLVASSMAFIDDALDRPVA
jgi:hypothetical protein